MTFVFEKPGDLVKFSKNNLPVQKNKKTLLLLSSAFLIFILFLSFFVFYISRSPKFPESGISLKIEKGMTVQKIAHTAKQNGLVRSETMLYLVLLHSYEPTSIYAGVYTYTQRATVFEVAQKLASSDIDKALLSITIPEGSTRKEIAEIASKSIAHLDTKTFLEKTKNDEGYLFPDTYYISADFSVEQLIKLLLDTHTEKLATLEQQLRNSKFSEKEVLTLASILEREAKDEQSMKMVSGILQNRLKLKMALQTDATIEYVLDKPLSELKAEDLKIDSPYNTYLYVGLPPTPISNPGLQAIRAVLEPTETDYLYYITDADGEFHYAKTFEAHKRNIAYHLNN